MALDNLPALGTIPPTFQLPDTDGTLISSADLHREKLALIVFFAAGDDRSAAVS